MSVSLLLLLAVLVSLALIFALAALVGPTVAIVVVDWW